MAGKDLVIAYLVEFDCLRIYAGVVAVYAVDILCKQYCIGVDFGCS